MRNWKKKVKKYVLYHSAVEKNSPVETVSSDSDFSESDDDDSWSTFDDYLEVNMKSLL